MTTNKITLRDRYAEIVMKEFIKNNFMEGTQHGSYPEIASHSFELADAMLAERNKEKNHENQGK